jgi:hypothetical protein
MTSNDTLLPATLRHRMPSSMCTATTDESIGPCLQCVSDDRSFKEVEGQGHLANSASDLTTIPSGPTEYRLASPREP